MLVATSATRASTTRDFRNFMVRNLRLGVDGVGEGLWAEGMAGFNLPGPSRASVDDGGILRADDLDVLDTGRQDVVPEFEEEPAARDEVGLDGAAPEGAAVDGGGDRRLAAPVEPAPRHAVASISKTVNDIAGVPGADY